MKNISSFLNDRIVYENYCACCLTLPIIESNDELINKNTFNLNARFEYWNERVFDSKIVMDGDVSFGKTPKGTSGITDSFVTKRGKRFLTVKDTKIVISDKNDYTLQNLDMILLHEMVHAYFDVVEMYDAQHDIYFKSKIREISKKVGFTVPLVDNITQISSNTKSKEVGCIIFDMIGHYNVIFMSKKVFERDIEDFKKMLKSGYTFATGASIKYGTCSTNLYERFPMVRNLKKLKLFKLDITEIENIDWIKNNESLIIEL